MTDNFQKAVDSLLKQAKKRGDESCWFDHRTIEDKSLGFSKSQIKTLNNLYSFVAGMISDNGELEYQKNKYKGLSKNLAVAMKNLNDEFFEPECSTDCCCRRGENDRY